MSNGLSGMGFGVPAAIAAQIVHPEKPVLAVVGDGGMLMMLHDLALIRELALPIIVIVLSDRSLSLIRVSEERRGIAPLRRRFHSARFRENRRGLRHREPKRAKHPGSARRSRTRAQRTNTLAGRHPYQLPRILRSSLSLK